MDPLSSLSTLSSAGPIGVMIALIGAIIWIVKGHNEFMSSTFQAHTESNNRLTNAMTANTELTRVNTEVTRALQNAINKKWK